MLKQALLITITTLGKVCGLLILRRNINNDPDLQIDRIIANRGISLIIDIGANEGQFAKRFINNQNIKKIISFEPLGHAYRSLKRSSATHPNWVVQNLALGNEQGQSHINVSQNSVSSSLRRLTEIHTKAAPNSQNIDTEEVTVTTLDKYFSNSENIALTQRILLKIDTQGFEREVLEGASDFLKTVDAVIMETSFAELYDGQALFEELHELMLDKGFKIYNIIPGFKDDMTGQLLQADCVYVKK